MTAPYIGPDTVELVIREPAAGVDEHGRPNRTERIVTVGNASITVSSVVETREAGRVVVYSAKACLPPDSVDARGIKRTDAIRDAAHPERTFELIADGVMKTTLLTGTDDHVRVFAQLEQVIGELEFTREQVTITPTFGRDARGEHLPDGDPFDVMARGVKAGNTTQTLDVDGTLMSADFTVSLDLAVPVKDGDRITVRGRTGYARVADVLEASATASERVVLVRARSGGRR